MNETPDLLGELYDEDEMNLARELASMGEAEYEALVMSKELADAEARN